MLGLRLDPELEQRVRRVARQHGRSTSDVMREAIRRFLDTQGEDEERARELRLIAGLTEDAAMDEIEAFAADLQRDGDTASARTS